MMMTRLADVEEWLLRLKTLLAQNSCPCPLFLKPFHFTTLAIELTRNEVEEVIMPRFLESYAARMELWGALGLKAPREIRKRDETGRFLPLTPVRGHGAVHDSAVRIREIAEAQYHGLQTLMSLEELLGEVLDNSFSHARIGANLPGFACAQAWPQGNLAQIAIGDGGIGIRNSLSENPALSERLVNENACLLATERYLTGKPGQHSGYGLALARDLIDQNGGSLVIVSGNEAFQSRDRRISLARLGVSWIGTLVVIEWRTDRPLDAMAVYERWTRDG